MSSFNRDRERRDLFCSSTHFFDASKNRFFKILPDQGNSDNSSAFLTRDRTSALRSYHSLRSVGASPSCWSLLLLLKESHIKGYNFSSWKLNEWYIRRFPSVKPSDLYFDIAWPTVDDVLIPNDRLEPIIISQNDKCEITLRFTGICRNQQGILKLKELHPSSKLFGNVINPCLSYEPHQLIFCQMTGLDRIASSIIFHNIEHGYDENLSFGSREIFCCAWDNFAKKLAIGSHCVSYYLDPESRAVQMLNTNNQDVLVTTFGSTTSSRSLIFNGCRNGTVICNDLREPSVAMNIVNNKNYLSTSLASLLASPMDEFLIILSDKCGSTFLWDLRNSGEPLGRFMSSDKSKNTCYIKFQLNHDGRYLYATGHDRTVRIWSMVSCKQIAAVVIPDFSITSRLNSACLVTDPKLENSFIQLPALFIGTSKGLHFINS